jgi:hypothetical protein
MQHAQGMQATRRSATSACMPDLLSRIMCLTLHRVKHDLCFLLLPVLLLLLQEA